MTNPRPPEAATPSLTDLAELYAKRVESLRTVRASGVATLLVRIFTTRDAIARRFQADECDPALVLEVQAVDSVLRRLSSRAEQLVGVDVLRQLKRTTSHGEQGWWWDIEQYLAKPSLFWSVLAGLLLAGAVGLITEVARRFFKEGPDIVGAIYIVVQTGLTLLAGSTLIGTGSGVLERWLDDRHVRRRRHGIVRAAGALVMLAAAFSVYELLPTIAAQYNSAGVSRAAQGGWSQAIQDFRRALSLAPDFSEAHYNLGRAYEAVAEYDTARSEYQKAVELQRGLYLAYNSLARLYIVDKKDPASALRLIDEALRLVSSGEDAASAAEARIALLKNRGWANLRAGNLAQARIDLREALAAAPERASVHCVLAQVDDAAGVTSDEWDLCLGYSAGATDVESDWLARAQDHAAKGQVVK